MYTDCTGAVIKRRGLFLSDSGLHGSSPDGAVSDNCIIEKLIQISSFKSYYLQPFKKCRFLKLLILCSLLTQKQNEKLCWFMKSLEYFLPSKFSVFSTNWPLENGQIVRLNVWYWQNSTVPSNVISTSNVTTNPYVNNSWILYLYVLAWPCFFRVVCHFQYDYSACLAIWE